MAIEQLFGHDQSDVDEDHFEIVFGGLFEGPFAGVANECEVIASAPPAMTVEVMTGTFVTGGCFARVSAQQLLNIGAADPVNPRIDRVVCRRDNATDTVTVYVLAGVAAGAPVPTALTRAGGIWEISLAQVYVAAAVVQINAADITDERFDKSVCGFADGRRAQEVLVYKLASEVVNNSAVMQNDDHLFFAVGANEVWMFELFIMFTSGVTPDINFDFTDPAGASTAFAVSRITGAVVQDPTYVATAAAALSVNGLGVGTTVAVHFMGTIVTAAAAGTLQLRWAQRVADPSNTTVAQYSWLKAHRVA